MMSPERYGQLATLVAKGRLQYRPNGTTDWIDVRTMFEFCAEDTCEYRERPEHPAMPSEVWLPDFQMAGARWTRSTCYTTREMCKRADEGAIAVRYVRAGAEVPGDRVEFNNGTCWTKAEGDLYRFKP